jgi:hypothetical protein
MIKWADILGNGVGVVTRPVKIRHVLSAEFKTTQNKLRMTSNRLATMSEAPIKSNHKLDKFT